MKTPPGPLAGTEGRLPPEIAAKAEFDGVATAGPDALTLLVLGVLGGAFIAFGAIFSNLALTGAEAALPFGRAVILGVLCNTLVCLAVWLSLSSRLAAHRLLVVVLPTAAFVAAGFEHAVANMYFLGFGLLIRNFAGEAFWAAVGFDPSAFPRLGFGGAAGNLLAVTAGNILGGAVFVAGIYWLLYRRPRGRR